MREDEKEEEKILLDERYMRLLDAGLFTLQLLCVCFAYLCRENYQVSIHYLA